jgi:hypothetical protein
VRANGCFDRPLANIVHLLIKDPPLESVMKSRSLLISAILATTTGLGFSGNALSGQPDAQAQAAALLSTSHTRVSESAPDQGIAASRSVAPDAHAQAAALLRGLRNDESQTTAARTTSERVTATSLDAQAQAARLLSGSRITVAETARTTALDQKLGEHPAVLAAQRLRERGIDPNTFIVAHPARLQLFAASPSAEDAKRSQATVTASTEIGLPLSALETPAPSAGN